MMTIRSNIEWLLIFKQDQLIQATNRLGKSPFNTRIYDSFNRGILDDIHVATMNDIDDNKIQIIFPMNYYKLPHKFLSMIPRPCIISMSVREKTLNVKTYMVLLRSKLRESKKYINTQSTYFMFTKFLNHILASIRTDIRVAIRERLLRTKKIRFLQKYKMRLPMLVQLPNLGLDVYKYLKQMKRSS